MEATYDETIDTSHGGYAGFWLRFAAYLIDGLLIGVVISIVMGILGVVGFSAMGGAAAFEEMANSNSPDEVPVGLIAAMMGAYTGLMILSVIAGWLYFAAMESSYRQATIGKMAVGIKVTNMHGERISFLNATGRYFGKIVSGMILYIGFLMAGFTEKKQALHDMMASTLVVRK